MPTFYWKCFYFHQASCKKIGCQTEKLLYIKSTESILHFRLFPYLRVARLETPAAPPPAKILTSSCPYWLWLTRKNSKAKYAAVTLWAKQLELEESRRWRIWKFEWAQHVLSSGCELNINFLHLSLLMRPSSQAGSTWSYVCSYKNGLDKILWRRTSEGDKYMVCYCFQFTLWPCLPIGRNCCFARSSCWMIIVEQYTHFISHVVCSCGKILV